MPAVPAPYGLRVVNKVDGSPFPGASRQMRIASNYGTSIFFGDIVKMQTDGTLAKDTGTDAATPIGIFYGCSYTDPNTGQKLFKQYYPASTVASDIMAFVVDDTNVLMKVAVCSSGTTMATLTTAAIGANVALIQNTGSTITGNSTNAINSGSPATTNTLPLRVVDIVPESDSTSTTFTEVLVKWNVGHAYTNTQGI